MKPIIAIVLFLSTYSFSFGQENADEIQLLQSLYGMDKRSIIEEFVEIDQSQSNSFWELYEEYEVKRKALGQKRFALLKKYVDEFGEVSEKDASNFMKEAIGLRIKSDNLKDSYYKKLSTATDPVVAMQFYQIETYLSDLIRQELLEGIYTSKN